jgi:hypothetical protein
MPSGAAARERDREGWMTWVAAYEFRFSAALPAAAGVNSILTDFACSGAIANGPVPESNVKGGASAASDTVSVSRRWRLWTFNTSVLGDTPIPTGPDRMSATRRRRAFRQAPESVLTLASAWEPAWPSQRAWASRVADGVAVAVGVADGIGVGDGVDAGVDVGVDVGVGDGVGVGVGVGEAAGVGVAVARGWSYSSTPLSAESAM